MDARLDYPAGSTLLIAAAFVANVRLGEMLIQRGANVNATTDGKPGTGFTALEACVGGVANGVPESREFFRLLLDHGANPDVPDPVSGLSIRQYLQRTAPLDSNPGDEAKEFLKLLP